MAKTVTITHFVAEDDPGNHIYRDVHPGEKFYIFRGATYGCVDSSKGIALSEKGAYQTPFFQFPLGTFEVNKGENHE